jgi:predicted dehydrogenase
MAAGTAIAGALGSATLADDSLKGLILPSQPNVNPAPAVHVGENNTIRLALIGCGGRGSGAVGNAIDAAAAVQIPVKLYAMADIFADRIQGSHASLSKVYSQQVDVPQDRRFVGFDAYKKAIDSLRPGDIAMLCGYAGFRPAQLEYAVQKGVHVFMEKSFAADPPGVRRVIKAGEEAQKKNLKIAAGLMCRHSANRQELIKRIRDGQLGTIQLIRAYRMEGIGPLPPKPATVKDIEYQVRNFTNFFWVSGGLYAEMHIHQIDEICWIKGEWPISAHGVGGRTVANTDCGQGLDAYSVEWTFADGTKAYDVARWAVNCYPDFATYMHGTKAAAQFSGAIHASTCQIFKDQRIQRDNIAWKAPKEKTNLWQREWEVLLDAVRNDKPHNEAKRAAMSNLADIMGRAAVHMGRIITRDEAMASNFQWCPNADRLTIDSQPPVKADAKGHYPVPVPGAWTEI